MYPLVGGTSTTCQYNLINTSSYQLAFSGSWNFNNNGISGSGTNNYAATGFRPLTASFDNLNKNNSFGVYVESNIAGGYDMGEAKATMPWWFPRVHRFNFSFGTY
jgi:hypothetical protein